MRVLVTRPQPDADDTAAELMARGHDSVVAPLLEVTIDAPMVLDLSATQAILVTSANGARALAAATGRRDLPVYAVGNASAMAARASGFDRTESADGNVEALAELVAARLSPDGGALLHVAGTVTAGDLSGMLSNAGYTVNRAVLYRAEPVPHMPAAIVESLRAGVLDAILFYSPRTAAHFVALATDANLSSECARVAAIALSRAVADKLDALPFAEVRVADSPDQFSLFRVLDGLDT